MQQELRPVARGVAPPAPPRVGIDLALRRRPGADPRIERPGGEVGVRLRGADLGDHALDAHHALQLDPVELQRGLRIAVELARLAAAVIRVPDEAALVVTLDQDDPRRRPAGAVDGRQRHRVGFRQLRGRAPRGTSGRTAAAARSPPPPRPARLARSSCAGRRFASSGRGMPRAAAVRGTGARGGILPFHPRRARARRGSSPTRAVGAARAWAILRAKSPCPSPASRPSSATGAADHADLPRHAAADPLEDT